MCGDGIVDSAEACDGGSCCSAKCKVVPDGAACTDACVVVGTCQAGVCTGGTPVTCGSADPCSTGTCYAGPLDAGFEGTWESDVTVFDGVLGTTAMPFRSSSGAASAGKWLFVVGPSDAQTLPFPGFPGCTGVLKSSSKGTVKATLKCKTPATFTFAKSTCTWKGAAPAPPRELPDALTGTWKCTSKDTSTKVVSRSSGTWAVERTTPPVGCVPAAAGTACRVAAHPCDLPEACDGVHTTCPADAPCDATDCVPCSGSECLPPTYATATCNGGTCDFTCDSGYTRVGTGCEPVCGDSLCVAAENCTTCSQDCGACPSPECGDSICAGSESCSTCPGDCGLCPLTRSAACAQEQACCTESATPGCAANPEREACVCEQEPSCCTGPWDAACVKLVMAGNCGYCPGQSLCGNFDCEPGENPANCPDDCPTPQCGDGACEPGEDSTTCSFDCPSTFCECDCQGCSLHTGSSVVSVASCTFVCGLVPCGQCDANDWVCFTDPTVMHRVDSTQQYTVCTDLGCSVEPWMQNGGLPGPTSTIVEPLIGDICPSCACGGSCSVP